MAGSFNRITLVGNLTRDPEIRYVGSGAAVTKFTLAVNRRSKQQEETDYIDCVAWDKLAETCNTYLKKGMSCLVDGRLSIREVVDLYGQTKRFDVIAITDHILMARDLLHRYHGNVSFALAAYNAGPGLVDAVHGIPAIPETRSYVARITAAIR